MKKETSNQFTREGMVCDLNPINTPNTVLTDNLNGTIITYNGNEFSLQNDRGNYELKHCRLKPNYIPVGIKEYGDILYIVSYNPLDKHVEVGTYPSPLMISETSGDNYDVDVTSIIQSQIIDKGLKEGLYKEVMNNADSIIFNGDNFKLNPGDMYCLQQDINSDLHKYETIDYYILGEDSSIHNVNDKIKIDVLETDPDYEHVAWTIPGWINIKTRLVELSSSGINVKYFYVPKTDGKQTAHFSFNLRLNVNDPHLLNKKNGTSILEEWCVDPKDVGFRLNIEVDGTEVVRDEEFYLNDKRTNEYINFGEWDWSDWYEDSRILWKTISGKISDLKTNSIVKIKVTPIINDDNKYTIVYDNLTQELLFDLSSVDNKPWTFGSDLYQFYLNDDKTGVVIYTNVDGPLISSFPINLKYSIKTLDGKYIVPKTDIVDYKGIGENIIEIPFTDKIKQEEIYIFTLWFYDNNGFEFHSSNRILITSSVFNDFSDRLLYDKEIKLNEWISHVWNLTENKYDIKVEEDSDKVEIVDDFDINNLSDSDKKYFSGEKYNTFFLHEVPGLSSEVIFNKGWKHSYKLLDLGFVQNKYKKGLWKYINIDNTFEYYDYLNDVFVKLNEGDTVDLFNITRCILKYKKVNMPFEFIDGLSPKTISETNDFRLIDKPVVLTIECNGRKVSEKREKKTMCIHVSWNGESLETKISKDNDGAYQMEYNEEVKQFIRTNIFEKTDAQFLLLKATFLLEGRSDNFELAKLLYGQIGAPKPYTFHLTEDGEITIYYVIVRDEDNYPILLPLSDSDGDACFDGLCKDLYVNDTDGTIKTYDRYLLQLNSKTELDERLLINHLQKLQSELYYGVDLLDDNTLYLKNLGCEFTQILTEGLEKTTSVHSVTVYDEKLFKEKHTFPNNSIDGHKGIVEFEGWLNVLNSNSELEFNLWEESVYNREYKSRLDLFGTTKGIYCEHVDFNDYLLKSFNKSYIEKSIISLTAASVDDNLKPSYNRVVPKIKDEINKATWLVFNNWWKILIDGTNDPDTAASKDWYIAIGHCWKEDPAIELSKKWNWIV